METLGTFKLAGAQGSGASYSVERDEPEMGGRVTLFVHPCSGASRYQVLAAPDLPALAQELKGILQGVEGVAYFENLKGGC